MSAAPNAREKITTRPDAEALLARIGDAMVALVRVFEKETRLVKSGRLVEASALLPEKSELAGDYLREIELFKANGEFVGRAVPALLEEMRRAHAAFRDILALNLRVVATAQSVAESVVRGAAEDAGRRAAPQSYRQDGRVTSKPASRPVIVSRSS